MDLSELRSIIIDLDRAYETIAAEAEGGAQVKAIHGYFEPVSYRQLGVAKSGGSNSTRPVLATQCAHPPKLADVVGNEHGADGYRVRGDDRVEAADGTPRFLQRSTYFAVRSLDGAIDG